MEPPENTHIKYLTMLHRDILISSIAARLAGAITFLACMSFFFRGSRDEADNLLRRNPDADS